MFEGATIRPRGGSLFAHLPLDAQDRARAALAASLDRAGQRHLNVPPWRFAAYVAAAISTALHGAPPNYNQRLAYRRWKKVRALKRAIEQYGDPTAPNPVDHAFP